MSVPILSTHYFQTRTVWGPKSLHVDWCPHPYCGDSVQLPGVIISVSIDQYFTFQLRSPARNTGSLLHPRTLGLFKVCLPISWSHHIHSFPWSSRLLLCLLYTSSCTISPPAPPSQIVCSISLPPVIILFALLSGTETSSHRSSVLYNILGYVGCTMSIFYFILKINHTFCIHSLLRDILVVSSLVITNKTAMNLLEYVSLWYDVT